MGQDTSKQQQTQPTTPSSPFSIPYTSFSVPKGLQQLSSNNNTTTTNNTRLSTTTTSTLGTDDIVQVVSVDQNQVKSSTGSDLLEKRNFLDSDNDLLSNEVDEELIAFSKLPEIYPLIKSKLDNSSTLSNLLKFTKKELITGSNNNVFNDVSLKELDSIDPKPLIDILAEFQTYSIHQNRSVAVRQDEVLKQLKIVHLKAHETNDHLEQKNQQLQKIASELREVERLDRYVEQNRKYIDFIILQIRELECLLPHNVRASIQTPLFEKCHEVEEHSPEENKQ
ncbi:hypothetical protein ABK040_007196 [Willaertia magna]